MMEILIFSLLAFSHFEPQSTSTPKKINTSVIIPNLCSTPRPAHVRYSLGKYAPLPVDCSTPQTKKMKKSFAPNIHRLIYPSNIPTTSSMKILALVKLSFLFYLFVILV